MIAKRRDPRGRQQAADAARGARASSAWSSRSRSVWRWWCAGVLVAAFAGGSPAGEESYLNFESGPVRPLAISSSGELLFAANLPDSRVEVFRATDDGLERVSEVVVGLEPVALVLRGDTDLYVVNHLSDSVSVVDVRDPSLPYVRATLLVGDEPRDVVVGGPERDKIFVTTAHRGQNNPRDPQLTTPGVGRGDVWIFDADELDMEPHVLTLFCDTPRALAVSPDGTRVYAAAFHSGNQTTALSTRAVGGGLSSSILGGFSSFGDGFESPGMAPPLRSDSGDLAPSTGLILEFDGAAWRDPIGRDWTPRVRFDLPDLDVFTIDATQEPPVEVAASAHVGTVLFNLAVHPVDGRVYVSNLDARNIVRFEPELNGHVAENRVTIIDDDAVTPVHLNPHIDYTTPSGDDAERAASVAFPLDLVFSGDGETLYVAAFGSRRVAVLDAEARVVDRIDVGGGPSGLALDETRGRLYALNRFDQTISVVSTEARRETTAIPLRYDPEPPAIREGRPVLYDARLSGHGDSACASCHIFADLDGLSWDLGDPGGLTEINPLPRALGAPGLLKQFHPMKGPMSTQSLRGLVGAGAMHWRGDRNAIGGGTGDDVFDEGAAFLSFRPAFQTLLGLPDELPVEDMEKFRDFILTVRYPPNPIAGFDGLNEDEKAGEQIFLSNGSRLGLGGDGGSCEGCHELPLGTGGFGNNDGESQDFKTSHLRNMYQKVGMFGYALPNIVSEPPVVLEQVPTAHMGEQVRGYGYLHDGSVPTLLNFFRLPGQPFNFPDEPGRSSNDKVRELTAFMMAFPTGLDPIVGQQVTVDKAQLDATSARVALLHERADAGECELVVHGNVKGRARGFLYTEQKDYQSERRAVRLTRTDLFALVESDAVLTLTAVYPGGGERLAVDRDGDRWYNLDEVDSGSDPADPLDPPGPQPPRRLTARAGLAATTLDWEAAPAHPSVEVVGYAVYRSREECELGERVATTGVGRTFRDELLPEGTFYYRVAELANTPREERVESLPSAVASVTVETGAPSFVRGDCDGDGELSGVTDAVALLEVLFLGRSRLLCLAACDADGDGVVKGEVTDAVFLLRHRFLGGPPPPAPFPTCGRGVSVRAAELGCDRPVRTCQ